MSGVIPSIVLTVADRRLEVFIQGTDEALWHTWQTPEEGASGQVGTRWGGRTAVLSWEAVTRSRVDRLIAYYPKDMERERQHALVLVSGVRVSEKPLASDTEFLERPLLGSSGNSAVSLTTV